MKKKFIKSLITGTALIMLLGIHVSADTGEAMSWEVRATSKGGWVDGSANGKYYSLTKGNVSLQDVSSNGGQVFIKLYRERDNWADKSFGSKDLSKDKLQWQIDEDSSKYYFYITVNGDTAYTKTYTGSGTVHDHGI